MKFTNTLIEETIHSFLELIEKRDSYTAGHSVRVAYYSTEIAKELNLNDEEISLIYNSALLHDIGKIGVPDTILLKPGKFTLEEFRIMQDHVNLSFKTVKSIDYFSKYAYIIKDHHEKYNGKGYPEGKKGDEISIYSYILSLADSFDGLTTSRIYNQSKTPKEAYEILKAQEGKDFPENFVSSVRNVLLNEKRENANQNILRKRTTYNFKDTLTKLNSETYLNFFLLENIKSREYEDIYFICVRGMSLYNKNNGWEKGDIVLKEFSNFLKNYFIDSEIFRVRGDDFLVMSKSFKEFDENDIKDLDIENRSSIKFDIHHLDFSKLNIDTIKDFEDLLFEKITKQYKDENKKSIEKILKDETKSYEEKIKEIDLSLIIKDFELYSELGKAKDRGLKSLISEKDDLAKKFFNLNINLQLIANFDGKIIDISDSCATILGYKADELLNSSFLDLVHQEDIEATVHEMEKLNRGEVVNYFENRYKHKDGHYVVLAWSACANDKLDLIYASAHDKTESKQKEKVLDQQSKMASMGEMIENIAHQWKQPLSLIKGISSGLKLKKEFNMLEDKEFYQFIDEIVFATEHMSETINDFKSFFNSEEKLKEFNLENTIKKVETLLLGSLKSADIKIIKNIESCNIFGSESKLLQVLINIINNAKDEFIRNNQKDNFIFIDIKNSGSNYIIKIKDNAGGIPYNIINKVFDSHFTTKQDIDGTGIGLYMAKLIIEKHMKGTIEVKNSTFEYENSIYNGAEFIISF